ncbi:unnamed protein product [Blepharisma stoltei]|uniref:Endonuclease/exonuclease/phosphatase domain-containing protein n=1 Tax=Blepharisma stoltei TaxID=1481888 RepID=A0AAU9J8U0_9CILI|nr:unnamed protein product [Blepharisma stoltei]
MKCFGRTETRREQCSKEEKGKGRRWCRADSKEIKLGGEAKTMTVSHINIHGIRGKKQQLELFIEENKPDILGVSETHSANAKELPVIKDYVWVCSPGTDKSAGVGILHKKDLSICETHLPTGGRVSAMLSDRLAIMEVYSPVEGSSDDEMEKFYDEINRTISWVRLRERPLLLMGDFNAHLKGWWAEQTNSNGKRTKALCLEWGLNILEQKESTHLRSSGTTHCINFYLADNRIMDRIIDIKVNIDNSIRSDHLPLTLKLWDQRRTLDIPVVKRIRFDRLNSPVYLKVYQKELNNELLALEPEAGIGTEDLYGLLNKIQLSVAGRAFGYTSERMPGTLSRTALNELRAARRHRWKALKLLKKGDHNGYSEQMTRHKLKMKSFKLQVKRDANLSMREKEIENMLIGAKDMWEVVRNLKKAKRGGNLRFTSKEEGVITEWWTKQYNWGV